MSHDRKPGRVRVMKAGDPATQRRRGDGPGLVLDPAVIARTRSARRRATLLLTLLFLLAAIASAVATELYLPS